MVVGLLCWRIGRSDSGSAGGHRGNLKEPRTLPLPAHGRRQRRRRGRRRALALVTRTVRTHARLSHSCLRERRKLSKLWLSRIPANSATSPPRTIATPAVRSIAQPWWIFSAEAISQPAPRRATGTLATITARPATVSTMGIADFRTASLKSKPASLAWSSASDARSSTNSATPSNHTELEPGTPAAARPFTDA